MPNGEWKSVPLSQDPANPADWTGELSNLPNPNNIRFMVQAVNGVGLVSLSTNLGAYYTPDVDPGAPPPVPSPDDPPAAPATLALITPPAVGHYGASAIVTAELTSNDEPVPGATVSLSLGFQSVQLVTGNEGRVTHIFPLNAIPGDYLIRTAFAGNEGYAPAQDVTASFVIDKQPTILSLAPAINGNVDSFIAELVDSENNALGQQTIIFILSQVDGTYTTALAAFTDPAGMAIPDLTDVPPGRYNVTAYFGQPIPNPGIDLTSELYGPSSDTDVFDIRQVFTSNNQLDDFNQGNGPLSNQWQNRSPGSYRIVNHQLDVIAGGPLYWMDAAFGRNQGVQVTFVKVDPNSSRQALLLKVQGGSQPDWREGVIALVYDAKQHLLRVETYQPDKGQKWTLYEGLQLTLHDGDQLGAMAFSDGTVRIFLNGNLVTTMALNTADQDFFNIRGGYIGLWFAAANEAMIDSFGGGTIFP
jgi:hypothetical protein